MKTLDLRTILGTILIFCVIAGGCSLWYHHEMRKLDAEDKAFYQRLEQLEQRKAARNHASTASTDATETRFQSKTACTSGTRPMCSQQPIRGFLKTRLPMRPGPFQKSH